MSNKIDKNKIDNMATFAEVGAEILFSPIEEGVVDQVIIETMQCKKVCKIIGIIVFVICATIIYFHLRG